MDVFLINLDRDTARLRRMAALLEPAGIAYRRIAAIDKTALHCHANPGPNALALPSHETACLLSHRKAWRAFLRTDADWCAILEDDAVLGNDFTALITDPALVAHSFDIIKLETGKGKITVDYRHGGPVRDRAIAELLSQHLGAAGYLLSRNAARRLMQLRIGEPVDVILFDDRARPWRKGLRIGQVIPGIVIQQQHLSAQADSPNPTQGIAPLHWPTRHHRGKPRGLAKLSREMRRPMEQFSRWLDFVKLRRHQPAARKIRIPFR